MIITISDVIWTVTNYSTCYET